MNGRLNCPTNIFPGSTCRHSEKVGLTGCAYVLNPVPAGVVHCSLPDNGENTKMYFFNGLRTGANLGTSIK